MFYKLLILCLVFYSLNGHRLSPHPPAISQGARILGGQGESTENAPWQASLQYYSKHFCGGTIYNERIIITAAHCVRYRCAKYMTVRIGSTYHNFGGTVFRVANYFVHEKFDAVYLTNDIAIVLLSSSIDLSTETSAKNISLANESPAPGTVATVTGWGWTLKGPTLILQMANMSIVYINECRDLYHDRYVTSDMICAGSPGKEACSEDSGGPLVVAKKLVGILSWGKNCGYRNYPGVYANVVYFRDWINKISESMVKYQLLTEKIYE